MNGTSDVFRGEAPENCLAQPNGLGRGDGVNRKGQRPGHLSSLSGGQA